MGDNGKGLNNAARDGDEAAVRALLGQGVHPDEWRDLSGRTALHEAAINSHTAVVRLLIEAGADLEAKDSIPVLGGSTPLHLAVTDVNADVRVAQLLLNKGANVAARDDSGRTPLHDAARTRDTAIIVTLLLWGADLDAQNNRGETSRDVAANWDEADYFDAAVASARGLFWTRALHPRLPRPSREVVVTVLLCLRPVATPGAPGAALLAPGLRRAVVLPALPVELWEMILGFLRAVDLFPRRV